MIGSLSHFWWIQWQRINSLPKMVAAFNKIIVAIIVLDIFRAWFMITINNYMFITVSFFSVGWMDMFHIGYYLRLDDVLLITNIYNAYVFELIASELHLLLIRHLPFKIPFTTGALCTMKSIFLVCKFNVWFLWNNGILTVNWPSIKVWACTQNLYPQQ